MDDRQQSEGNFESQTEACSTIQAPNESDVNQSGVQNVETETGDKQAFAPTIPRRNRVRTTVPSEGVELAVGTGGMGGAEPITFGHLFQQRVQEFPNVAALKWKEKVGDGEQMVWKTASYAEYYKSCVDTAKSLLKASLHALIDIPLEFLLKV